MLEDIWSTTTWKPVKLQGKNQIRLFPAYRRDKAFKKELRNKHLTDWNYYAAHWIDSALKTAYSIMDSWKKNYNRGKRKARLPTVNRLFLRAKQTLIKLEGEKLRVTISPQHHVYFDLSKRYFKLPDTVSSSGIGEPVITFDRIHLPIHTEKSLPAFPQAVVRARRMAWDSNMLSLDGFSPETGWVKIDTRRLASVHISSFEKRRRVQKRAKSKKAWRVLGKYSRRERNRAKKHQIEIARAIASQAENNGFESLRKERLYTRSRLWNRRIARTDWRSIRWLVGNNSVELAPNYTSKRCSRCGWLAKDLKGSRCFECRSCGARIDRQLNAAINLYLKMEGVPHNAPWWDGVVLSALVGGYVQTGAERKATDELVRSLHEAVKPQTYIAYNRYADSYLRRPM
nr:zinc ribbon domain-containing protein [Candidatus Freyarchaeota archaeon]